MNLPPNDDLDDDEELLRALGRTAADEDEMSPDEEVLARWCAGTLSASEIEVLARRAASEPELAQKREAYRPLDAGARGRLTERLLAERRAEATAAPISPLSAAPSRKPSRSVRRVWGWGAGGLGLAAAAAWLFWVGMPAREGGHGEHRIAALPSYEIDASGGDRDTRGPQAPLPTPTSAGSVKVLRPLSRLERTVRPATAIEGRVSVEAFAWSAAPAALAGPAPASPPSSELASLALRFDVSPAGVAHLSARADEIFGARRGTWELRLLVARPEVPADERRTLAAGAAASGPGWQRLSVSVLLVDSP